MKGKLHEIGSFYEKEELVDKWFNKSCDVRERKSALSFFSALGSCFFFESGRAAESAIVDELTCIEQRHVCLMPEYTCDTVIKPFSLRGWRVYFYHLSHNLEPDIQDIEKKIRLYNPTVILSILYYGVDTAKEIRKELQKWRKEKKGYLIEDYTQALAFIGKNAKSIDYAMMSLRKWFPMSGGGIASLHAKPLFCDYTDDYVLKQKKAQEMKYRYLIGENIEKTKFLELHEEAERLLDKRYDPINMDLDSYNMLCIYDIEEMMIKRKKNSAVLKKHLEAIKGIKGLLEIDTETSPLYYPIIVENRGDLQKFMRERNVFLPVLWPIPEEIPRNDISNNINDVYNNMLAIPCDHRYNEDDMDYIGGLLESYDKGR